MASEVLTPGGLKRIADQLQLLSELTESLTYRLLELEEKVALTEARLEPLLSPAARDDNPLSEETELRLDDTEERLARLEALLAGLQPLPRQRQQAPVPLDSTFPDEDFEQPFLDEQELEADLEADDDRLTA